LAQRQRILDELAAIHQLRVEDRCKLRDKKRQYGSDLIAQMEYEQCKREADRDEEARLIERQELAEQEWNDQLQYLMRNPVAFKRHPMRQKYDEMLAAMPVSTCMSPQNICLPAAGRVSSNDSCA
jgi:hypothetical protein